MKRRKISMMKQLMTALVELCKETSELCGFTRIAVKSEDPELIRQGAERVNQLEEKNRCLEEQIMNL